MIDLVHVETRSGVNHEGRPFVTVTATGTAESGGLIMVGQLDPETARTMALGYLESAEAAEHDAALFRVLREIGLDDPTIGGVIGRIRDERSK